MDYDVARCTRHCAITGREFVAGEPFYSALVAEGNTVERRDYSIEAWQGPPEGSLGWWKSQLVAPETKKVQWAPTDVMLNLLEELADDAERADLRYVLALLLIRRRVLRLEQTERDEAGRETISVSCARRGEDYTVAVVLPDAARVEVLEQELARLLVAGAQNSG